MSRASFIWGTVLLFCHLSIAATSNLEFDTSPNNVPDNSISNSGMVDRDSLTTPETGVLLLTVTDSTLAMVDRGTIMIWPAALSGAGVSKPLRTLPLQKINAPLTLVEIPRGSCFVSVELSGSVLGSDSRYATFITGSDGTNQVFDFSKNDTLQFTIIVREKHRTRSTGGRGIVDGTVTPIAVRSPRASIAVLLYDAARGRVDRGGTVEADGSFRFDNIAAGTYRIAAAIDTNNDKSPDVTAIADTLLSFTGAEFYSGITIGFSEKPSGPFRITGRISGIGVVPGNVFLTVAALPVDTMASEAVRFDAVSFMAAYRAPVLKGGVFTISDLPGGVYYVVAVAEGTDTVSGRTGDMAFGVYGDLLLGNFDDAPFTPWPVVLDNSSAPKPIVITLLMRGAHDRGTLISGSNVRIPADFALQSARIDATGAHIRIEFAVPQPATTRFSLDDMAGHTIANVPDATFAPGFHTITLNVDRSVNVHGTLLYVTMKCANFQARQAVAPPEPTGARREASSLDPYNRDR